jgi:hypothetical protein
MNTMTLGNWVKGSILAAVALATPLTAKAHDRVDVAIRVGEPAPCVERGVRIWVEPVYRTVTDRVWVEPVYKTVCENVWVPERCEVRETVCFERGHRIIRRDRVIAEPGHFDRVERRVLVAEGHFDCVERQELVCAGHYETRVVRVDRPHWHDRDVAFGARWHD